MITTVVVGVGCFVLGLGCNRSPLLTGTAESVSKLLGRAPLIGRLIRPLNII